MSQSSYVTVYGLTDPRTGEVRYVGKTTWTLAHRLKGHISDAKCNTHTHKARWINDVLKVGLRPRAVPLETVPSAQWEQAERRWIAAFPRLTNTTAGGQVGGWGWSAGEACPSAKLNEASVRTICGRYSEGGVTQQQLADEYGVTSGAIARIVRGDNWKHVDRPITVRGPGAPGVSRNAGNRHGAKDHSA